MLGLAARPWEEGTNGRSEAVEEHNLHEDPMKRRLLLAGALASGITGIAADALASTRRDLDTALNDNATAELSYWETTAERHSYGYGGRAPAEMLAELLSDFSELQPLLASSQTVTSRQRLCHVAAQMAAMTAIVLHDLGEHRESSRWFHTARRAAVESGNNGLHAWVLGREAMVPLNFGAPAVSAAIAERALSITKRESSAATALSCAVVARAYAASGNREGALAAVERAELIVERLSPEQCADTWFGYPMQKHHVHLSQALTLLGETDRAYAQQARAIELSRRPSVMTRALIAIDQASCLVVDGEPDEAARVAAVAYRELPASYRSGLTRDRAYAVYEAVRASRQADELREALEETD
ncbi:hypothetical protein GCM10022245_46750 [Streptomyces mayteni]